MQPAERGGFPLRDALSRSFDILRSVAAACLKSFRRAVGLALRLRSMADRALPNILSKVGGIESSLQGDGVRLRWKAQVTASMPVFCGGDGQVAVVPVQVAESSH